MSLLEKNCNFFAFLVLYRMDVSFYHQQHQIIGCQISLRFHNKFKVLLSFEFFVTLYHTQN